MATAVVESISGDPAELLRERFGMDRFRSGQQQVVEALLAGRSAAAVFPTGGGKSLCYQLPALMLPGVTLVVSPLLALMKDQCDALARRGIRAGRLDSSMDSKELSETMRSIRAGETKILYVSPERFFNERFRAVIEELPLSMFAIDEAHCISQWGHNFRPDYLKLADLTRELGVNRVLALTATATPSVLKDIRVAFSIAPQDVVQTPFFRPNLKIFSQVVREQDRDPLLLKRLKERPPGPTLIYATHQKTTEELAEMLQANGFDARAYHAGMESDQRAEIQSWFLSSDHAIVTATIAFGMGIDKPNIRYVYHYNPSKSIESFAQEIGRAGRDGDDSICETLLVPSDRAVLENFAFGDTPDRAGLRRLVEVINGQSDTFHVSHYKLASETNIRVLVVRTLLTYLELDGYLKGTSPRYDTYKFRPIVTSKVILGNFEGERRKFINEILCSAVKGKSWFSIPLSVTARRLGETRERLVKAIDYLGERGWIELQVSDLVHGYKKVQRISNVDELVDELHDRMVSREKSEVERLDQVFRLLAAPSCQAALLSSHFGQDMEQACGQCTACSTGPIDIPADAPKRIGRSAMTAVKGLAAKHPDVVGTIRAQARFLCGLSSPAMTRARLSRDPMFGACAGVPFSTVMQELTE
jgi:ATP-dependent DNA helicase RecQ